MYPFGLSPDGPPDADIFLTPAGYGLGLSSSITVRLASCCAVSVAPLAADANRPEGVPAPPTSPPAPAGGESLPEQLAAAHAAYKERHRCYQSNIRVLTRKLREYMRALKTAERELAERRSGGAPEPAESGLAAVEREEATAQLRRQLETARRDTQRAEQEAEQLRAAAADTQLLQLELEKERGRLEGETLRKEEEGEGHYSLSELHAANWSFVIMITLITVLFYDL